MNESLADFRFNCERKSLEDLKALRAHMDDDAVRQAEFETRLEIKLALALAGVTDDLLREQRRAITENLVRAEMVERRVELHEIIERKEQWALRGALLARGVIPLSSGTVGMPSRDEVFAKVRAELDKLKSPKIQPELALSADQISAIELDRATEKLTGKTTMQVLVADYGIPESTIGGWLRDWEVEEKISNTRPQKMNIEDVKFVRAALEIKKQKRDAKGQQQADAQKTDAAPT